MKVKFDGLCRGDNKVFIKVVVDGLGDDSSLHMVSTGIGGKLVPSMLLPIPAAIDAECAYVAVLPDLPFKQELIFAAHDASGRTIAEVQRELNPFRAKWESRLNYKMNKQRTAGLRDFDASVVGESLFIEAREAFNAGDRYRLRISVLSPAERDEDIRLKFLTDQLEELSLEVTPLGSSIRDIPTDYGQSVLDSRFSIEIPDDLACLLIIADQGDDECFLVWDEIRRNEMIDDWVKQHVSIGADPGYHEWFLDYRASAADLAKQARVTLPLMPTFSIIVPLYKTPIGLFEEMVDSVLAQSYPNWELVLANASPEDIALSERAQGYASSDSRIKLIALKENLGISLNTQAGIKEATGDFICFFDHDDVLEPDILFEYAMAVNEDPDTDLLYCDEDKIMMNGLFGSPYLKPDLSIDLLRNNNYICHMLCIRRALLDELEPSPKDVDGAQDHDLTLKAIEKSDNIRHVRKILYHWRMVEGSTAATSEAKPYATQAGIRAVQRHLDRLGIDASVSADKNAFTYRVSYALPDPMPKISIIIPNKDNHEVLATCVESIFDKTEYPDYEIIVVENNSEEEATFAYYDVLENDPRVKIVKYEGEFNYSKINDLGVEAASGSLILLLNNDTEVITQGWLTELASVCCRDDVGAVGAKLWYPDDVIQHAGIAIIGEAAEHIHYGAPRSYTGYFGLIEKPQDLSAVTAACLMTKKSVYERVGGLDPEFSIAYNDIDYCLKLRAEGLNVVYWPYVELYHHESLSRGSDHSQDRMIRLHREAGLLNAKWSEYYIKGDPFYNITAKTDRGHYQLRD